MSYDVTQVSTSWLGGGGLYNPETLEAITVTVSSLSVAEGIQNDSRVFSGTNLFPYLQPIFLIHFRRSIKRMGKIDKNIFLITNLRYTL